MKIKTAVIVGSGNVATHIGKALHKEGVKIKQVYSPTDDNAKALAKKLKAGHTSAIADIDSEVDIIIISIKDDALAAFCKKAKFGNTLTVHTSGSIDAAVLKACSKNYGVLYPFQTFTKDVKMKMKDVPYCIEGNNEEALHQIKKLAQALSHNVYEISGQQRPWLHIMGVFSSNFTNLMFKVAHQLAAEHNIPFEIVFPLISQTVNKVKHLPPADAQTGPAVRSDAEVVAKHLEMLAQHPDFKQLYKLNTLTINPLLKHKKLLITRVTKTKK